MAHLRKPANEGVSNLIMSNGRKATFWAGEDMFYGEAIPTFTIGRGVGWEPSIVKG